jgi:hypothetical protein
MIGFLKLPRLELASKWISKKNKCFCLDGDTRLAFHFSFPAFLALTICAKSACIYLVGLDFFIYPKRPSETWLMGFGL